MPNIEQPEIINRSDIKKLERALLEIEKEAGALTPDAVVEAAAAPDSVLHSYFCWDNTLAAERYRKWQARQLIASVRVVYSPGNRDSMKVRAFLNVQHGDSQNYFGTARVMGDDELRTRLLQQAKIEMQRFKEKYGLLRELAGVFAAIESVE